MRIISGIHKGRKLSPPKKLPVRPTTDRSKEALFNILNNSFEWSKVSVLDLFSGTGSISFEFASRGVKSITSVDQNKDCVNYINKISGDFDLNILTFKNTVLGFLKNHSKKFDIIFLDPPYAFELKDYEEIILILLLNNSKKKGVIIIEHSEKIKLDNIVEFNESRTYGNNSFSFFKTKP